MVTVMAAIIIWDYQKQEPHIDKQCQNEPKVKVCSHSAGIAEHIVRRIALQYVHWFILLIWIVTALGVWMIWVWTPTRRY